MVKTLIKRTLPTYLSQAIKRLKYHGEILIGAFDSPEPEFYMLQSLLKAGDTAIDVGANIGHYSKRLSEVVGITGRVYAFEPMPQTFELLASNVMMFKNKNVTLINAAVHCKSGIVSFSLPDDGNPYQASISDCGTTVACFTLDMFNIDRVNLIKIDVEGNEWNSILGMARTIEKHRPYLIVEGDCKKVEAYLTGLGYDWTRNGNSPNRLYYV